ncbi:MAG TPA: hypothetical protein VGQ81_03120 [Acidobacteriota bacterium]|jgi:hypothetical protein|nr:hypothetical protein [Acidobacteriota bacterium]
MPWLILGLIVLAAACIPWLLRGKSPYRDAVLRGEKYYCPHCNLDVSPANPMVNNFSGYRLGLRAHRRWCQVCEKNAEQHLIHRS